MHSLGFVAKTDEEAVDVQWPYWAELMEDSARERGWASPTMAIPPPRSPTIPLCRMPETVATKLAGAIRCSG